MSEGEYILVAKPGTDEPPQRCINSAAGRAAAAMGGRYPLAQQSRKTVDGFIMVTKDGERLHKCRPESVGYAAGQGMRRATDRELIAHGLLRDGELKGPAAPVEDPNGVRPKKVQKKDA